MIDIVGGLPIRYIYCGKTRVPYDMGPFTTTGKGYPVAAGQMKFLVPASRFVVD